MVASYSVNPAFTYLDSWAAPFNPPTLTFPTELAAPYMGVITRYFNVNLQTSAVPEPAPLALIGLAGIFAVGVWAENWQPLNEPDGGYGRRMVRARPNNPSARSASVAGSGTTENVMPRLFRTVSPDRST